MANNGGFILIAAFFLQHFKIKIMEGNTHLDDQIATLLGLTKRSNILEVIQHIKDLKSIINVLENQRKSWADMCINKQKKIDNLIEVEEFLREELFSSECNVKSLDKCVEKIRGLCKDEKIIELIDDTVEFLCKNMK